MRVIAKACVLTGDDCSIRSYAAQKALTDHCKGFLAKGAVVVGFLSAPSGSSGACLKAPSAVLQPPIRDTISLDPASLLLSVLTECNALHAL